LGTVSSFALIRPGCDEEMVKLIETFRVHQRQAGC